jgi:hypothetical protein
MPPGAMPQTFPNAQGGLYLAGERGAKDIRIKRTANKVPANSACERGFASLVPGAAVIAARRQAAPSERRQKAD